MEIVSMGFGTPREIAEKLKKFNIVSGTIIHDENSNDTATSPWTVYLSSPGSAVKQHLEFKLSVSAWWRIEDFIEFLNPEIKNTVNANTSFQDFSRCDYRLHWSWSNFFRHVAVCHSVCRYPEGSRVLEIGAADSPVESMLRVNFKRSFAFTKTDVNEKYSDEMEIFDVESEGLSRYSDGYFDCVILTEVIEHFDPKNAPYVLNEIYRVLSKNGSLLLTTPTPQKPAEELVWPRDHDFEYSFKELEDLVYSENFYISRMMPWSVNEDDYEVGGCDCFPRGLNRAIFALTSSPYVSRQIFIELKKRRSHGVNQYSA